MIGGMTSSSSAPSSRAQRGILVVLFWLALWFVGLPVLAAALSAFGGIGMTEIGLLALVFLGVGIYGTRRILRVP